MLSVRRIMFMCVFVTALLTASVFAADPNEVHTFDSVKKPSVYNGIITKGTSDDGGATYSYNDSFTVGAEGVDANSNYVLLMVKANIDSSGNLAGETPYSITSDSIVFVDQKVSDDNGEVFFDVLPSEVANSVLLLGGTFSIASKQSPLVLGIVYLGELSGFDISGTVGLQDRASGKLGGVTVSLKPAIGDTISETTNNAGEYYFIGVSLGDYKLTIERPGYLSYEKTKLSVEDTVLYKTVTLKGGDIIKDGQVTILDLSELLSAYLSNTNAPSDINGDGQVTILDLSTLLSNYLVSKTVEQ